LAALIDATGQAAAATLAGASLEPRGAFVELHFRVIGAQPAWTLYGRQQHLTIELDRTRLAIAPEPLAGKEVAPITGVNAAAGANGVTLIAIGVSGKVDYAAAFAGHELIVRFARAGSAPDIAVPIRISQQPRRFVGPPPDHVIALATLPRSAPAIGPSAPATLPEDHPPRAPSIERAALTTLAPRTSRPVVVIDPGHGGYDPGTLAATGVAEKELALAIATQVHLALEAGGVSAPLTRTDDRFLSLAERTGVANRERADLFVSIHLNSSPDRATSGIETYYLNNTTDRATIRLARIENSATADTGDSREPNLNYILTDLRQEYKANESFALARIIESSSAAQAAAASGTTVNMLGVKKGPFYVLVGAEMPAVLVECGFLSNASEAGRLADPRYQRGLADGIAAAIVRYLGTDAAAGNL
jgi:N-acetylmuramoyl-L-alanine amidase